MLFRMSHWRGNIRVAVVYLSCCLPNCLISWGCSEKLAKPEKSQIRHGNDTTMIVKINEYLSSYLFIMALRYCCKFYSYMFVIFIWQINQMNDYFHFFNHCVFEVPTVSSSVKAIILKDPMAFLLDSH